MRLLIDANLSLRVAHRLTVAGHDARHVFDVDLGTATDEEVLDAAADDDRVVVSSDTDFGALLARFDRTRPSFVLLRHGNELTSDAQADLLLTALVDAVAELDAGAVVSVSPGHLRAAASLSAPEKLRQQPLAACCSACSWTRQPASSGASICAQSTVFRKRRIPTLNPLDTVHQMWAEPRPAKGRRAIRRRLATMT